MPVGCSQSPEGRRPRWEWQSGRLHGATRLIPTSLGHARKDWPSLQDCIRSVSYPATRSCSHHDQACVAPRGMRVHQISVPLHTVYNVISSERFPISPTRPYNYWICVVVVVLGDEDILLVTQQVILYFICVVFLRAQGHNMAL